MCMYKHVSVGIVSVSACCLSFLQGITAPFHGHKEACYKRGVCDRRGEPGSGSPLYYINTWAMVWPTDYPAVAL